MSYPPNRFQIASRMHFLLLRELGQGIEVEQMLGDERYARDVLLVCDAHQNTELALLALQYRQTPRQVSATTAGHAQHRTDWSSNTSGFGLSKPIDSLDAPNESRAPQAASSAQREGASGRARQGVGARTEPSPFTPAPSHRSRVKDLLARFWTR